MTRLTWIRLLPAIVMLPAQGLAQQRPGPQPSRVEMEERIRERFGELVRRELGLTAGQLEDVQGLEESFQEQRRALVRRETRLRQRLRPRAGSATTEEEARRLLTEMAAVRAEEARLFRAEMDALLRSLSPEQVLRFYRLRDDLMQRVRRLRQRPVGPLSPEAGGRF